MSHAVIMKSHETVAKNRLDQLYAIGFDELHRNLYNNYSDAETAVYETYQKACETYQKCNGRTQIQELRKFDIDEAKTGFHTNTYILTIITLKPQL